MFTVKLTEFLALPIGTIYTRSDPNSRPSLDTTAGMCIKGKTIDYSWEYEPMWGDLREIIREVEQHKRPYKISTAPDIAIDTCHLDDDPNGEGIVFLIWEWYDIERLMKKLQLLFPFQHQQFMMSFPQCTLVDRQYAPLNADNLSFATKTTMPIFDTISYTKEGNTVTVNVKTHQVK